MLGNGSYPEGSLAAS